MLYLFLRRFLVAPLVKLLFRPKVTGLENIPADGPALLVSNHLAFCDSIGLSALALACNHCVDAGGYLRLAAPTPFLRKVLTVVGLAATLPMYRTVAAARAADSTQELAPVSPAP